jgi:ABC-type multidrug transport system fused ATPase/permease subunit
MHAVSYARLQAVFDMQGEDGAPGGQAVPQRAAADAVLQCTGVGIAYEGKAVLRDVSFTLQRGEIIAVLGASGSGKSSIVKALLRLVEHTGQIALFGNDIDALPLGALRASIAYVPEHSEVFDATVAENLCYAAPHRTGAQVRSALRDAALADEDLYEVHAGEGGGKLSGGQRQRVAIARALLKDAPLVLLDEPTASLDAESESRVLQTLQELKRQGKSLLIITHRESTASIADRVLRIHNGTLSVGTSFQK